MATKIYTKTGDKGTTSLIGGTKVHKSHIRLEAYGTIDELNAHIGFCNDSIGIETINKILLEIQDRLFTIGSSLACEETGDYKMALPDLTENDVKFLEKEIDKMEKQLTSLKKFILPGGHPVVSSLHIARCVCRRAERSCAKLSLESYTVEPIIIKYLNRLSDYLFVLSRFVAKQLNVAEIYWTPRM